MSSLNQQQLEEAMEELSQLIPEVTSLDSQMVLARQIASAYGKVVFALLEADDDVCEKVMVPGLPGPVRNDVQYHLLVDSTESNPLRARKLGGGCYPGRTVSIGRHYFDHHTSYKNCVIRVGWIQWNPDEEMKFKVWITEKLLMQTFPYILQSIKHLRSKTQKRDAEMQTLWDDLRQVLG